MPVVVEVEPTELEGHGVQTLEPAAAENEAAGQALHVDTPVLPLNRPAGHGEQVALAPSANLPTGQA